MAKEKLTYAQKVLSYLEGDGDEKKINSFYESVINQYKDDIELTEREQKRLKEKIEEAKEMKHEIALNINLNGVKSVDTRNAYAKDFGQRLLNFDYENIASLENDYKANKERIKILKDTIKYLETL